MEARIDLHEDLTAIESAAVTKALAAFGGRAANGEPLGCWEASIDDIIDMYDKGPSDDAKAIARSVWAALGRYVSITVHGMTTCEAECPGCYTRHQGWRSVSFDTEDYAAYRMSPLACGIHETRSPEHRAEDEALYDYMMEVGT